MAKPARRHPRPDRPLPLVGAHLSTAGGFSRVPGRALTSGAEAVQVFSSNPRTWRADPPDPEALGALADSLEEQRAPLFFHTIYLINLASPDPELRRRSALAIAHALLSGALARAAGVVTHIGSHRGQGFQEARPRVEEGIRTAMAQATHDLALSRPLAPSLTLPPLLLETGAGSGATVGRSLDELSALLTPLSRTRGDTDPPGLGICLDTAHLFAAGYPIHRRRGLDRFVSELEERGLLAHTRLVHLNDSAAAFASNRDRHANPGDGELGHDGLTRVVNHPAFAEIPFVLEVPGSEGSGPGATEIALVKTMRAAAPRRPKAQPAVPLPPKTQPGGGRAPEGPE